MIIGIFIAIIVLIILYIIFKPYFIKYDTTLLFTGTLGGGKTLNAVKTGKRIYKKTLFNVRLHNWWTKKINKIVEKHNKKADRKNEKTNEYIKLGVKKNHLKYIKKWQIREYQELPRLISNIPIRIKGGKNEIWSNVLEKEMLLLQKRIPEYSVVIIDEIPQLVNQFNWNIEQVQNNVNEFATFFRHYIGGKLIMTSQSDSQVVKQIRDKMNTFYWLSNFKKFLFFFYKCDICQFISSDVVGNVNTGFVEDNTKTIYGTLFGKSYDSRCYSVRYKKLPEAEYYRWAQFKTKKIIRFSKYNSPLDEKEN